VDETFASESGDFNPAQLLDITRSRCLGVQSKIRIILGYLNLGDHLDQNSHHKKGKSLPTEAHIELSFLLSFPFFFLGMLISRES
jgi:hypothetical protein